MTRNEDFEEFSERERRKAESYISAYVDFVKWTTVLGVAAIAWLSNSLGGQEALALVLGVLGLLVVAGALALAVIALKASLDLSGHEWDMARLHRSLALLDLFKSLQASDEFVETKSKELQGRFEELSKTGDKFQGTRRFNRLVTWHIALLIAGILLFAVGQLLSALTVS